MTMLCWVTWVSAPVATRAIHRVVRKKDDILNVYNSPACLILVSRRTCPPRSRWWDIGSVARIGLIRIRIRPFLGLIWMLLLVWKIEPEWHLLQIYILYALPKRNEGADAYFCSKKKVILIVYISWYLSVHIDFTFLKVLHTCKVWMVLLMLLLQVMTCS